MKAGPAKFRKTTMEAKDEVMAEAPGTSLQPVALPFHQPLAVPGASEESSKTKAGPAKVRKTVLAVKDAEMAEAPRTSLQPAASLASGIALVTTSSSSNPKIFEAAAAGTLVAVRSTRPVPVAALVAALPPSPTESFEATFDGTLATAASTTESLAGRTFTTTLPAISDGTLTTTTSAIVPVGEAPIVPGAKEDFQKIEESGKKRRVTPNVPEVEMEEASSGTMKRTLNGIKTFIARKKPDKRIKEKPTFYRNKDGVINKVEDDLFLPPEESIDFAEVDPMDSDDFMEFNMQE
jgi:hypothetical protein